MLLKVEIAVLLGSHLIWFFLGEICPHKRNEVKLTSLLLLF